MNALLLKVANRFGLHTKDQMRSAVQKVASRSWQAAAVNRLTQSWTTQNRSVDSEIRESLSITRARCRQLAQDNDYAKKFLGMVRSNVVGECGVHLKNKAMDPPARGGGIDKFANKLIEDAWWNWGKHGQCTVDRKYSFVQFQNAVMQAVAMDGEVLIRKVNGFGNKFDYALQLLECDYLDHEYNVDLGNGYEIRMGVEMDPWKAPIAYHLFKRNPVSNLFYGSNTKDLRERVPAAEIIHAFVPIRPEQTRGIPWMQTAAYRMNMLGKYEEAEVTASRAAASKMAFLTRTGANVEYTGEAEGNSTLMDAEPGAIEQLPVGMDIKALDWNHPNTAYEVFMKTALRGVASGLGVSYCSLANNLEAVNMSSGRLGFDEEREMWKGMQNWLIETVINPIFEDWLETQLLNQTIPLPAGKFDKFNAPDWRPRRWAYYQPVDDIAAKTAAVKAGFTSITRVLAEQGLDRDEVFEELAQDMEAAEALDLDLPAIIDPMIDIQEDAMEDAAGPEDSPSNEAAGGESSAA